MSFLSIFFPPSRFERIIMTALEDVQAKQLALDAKVDSANAKADLLIAGYVAQRAQIAELLAQGSGATQVQLQHLADALDATAAKLTQQEAEDDAALAP